MSTSIVPSTCTWTTSSLLQDSKYPDTWFQSILLTNENYWFRLTSCVLYAKFRRQIVMPAFIISRRVSTESQARPGIKIRVLTYIVLVFKIPTYKYFATSNSHISLVHGSFNFLWKFQHTFNSIWIWLP